MPYYPPPATAAAGTTVVGTTTIDFGAFPGKSDTSIDVTGQTNILSNSVISAWIYPSTATADHSADEHMLETIKIYVGNIVVGTGFTIYGFNSSEINENFYGILNNSQTIGNIGQGTRIYGQWTVAWSWN